MLGLMLAEKISYSDLVTTAAVSSAATAVETTTVAAAFRFWTGCFNADSFTIEISAVKAIDCLLSLFIVWHFDETETA